MPFAIHAAAAKGFRRHMHLWGHGMNKASLLNTVSTATLIAAAVSLGSAARAQDADGQASSIYSVQEMVVISERDRAGLLETDPSDVLFGLNKPLLETPRSGSFVSDTTLERYGIETVDQLKSTTPGTATASFYGVPGSVNVRGTLAESYFRGFKRVENRGTYPTLLGASSRVDIVRGPPTPNFGPGKVGGLLNFVPKTAKIDGGNGYLTEITGEVDVTVGSYDKRNTSFQGGMPLEIGDVFGGVYVYGELEDSKSFYKGVEPEHQMLQVATDLDFGGGLTTSFGGQYYNSEGYVQTAGWNRITQDLIDNGTYITGQDTTLVDTDGNGYLTPNELGGFGLSSYYFGFPPGADPRFTLDSGVGTTQLDQRTVHISDADFSDTTTLTLFADVVKEIGDDAVKLQLFYDQLDNQRFVSYGFPADYKAQVIEGRLTYDFLYEPEEAPITLNGSVGASHRAYDATKRESFNSGRIALDRRDISAGATATDILDSPFTTEAVAGQTWETDVRSEWSDTGFFANADVTFYDFLSILLGARHDFYEVTSQDRGTLVFGTTDEQSDKDQAFTYNVSAMLLTPWGVRPYFTYAETTAIEVSQAGDVSPSLVQNGSWLSDGELREVGIKFELLDAALTGSIAAYEQQRTRVDQFANIVGTTGKGFEAEFRYLATENLSFTFAGNVQHTTIKGPDGSFYYLRPDQVGVTGVNGYGGAYATFALSGLPGRSGSYNDESIPESVVSLFGTYTTDEYDWGMAGVTAGVTHTTETGARLTDSIQLPAYTLFNAAAFADLGDFELQLNVDNITDKEYYTPLADLYADVGVLPGKGREIRFTAKYKF